MDHLPYPANSAHDPLRVPFLLEAQTVLDCRTDRPIVRLGANVSSYHLPELTQKLQTWLHCGLISRCIGKGVAVWDFLSDRRLDSRHLPGLLRDNHLVIVLELV